MMLTNSSISISIVSIVLGIGAIKYYGVEGSYMVLAILGAPLTFLNYIFRWYTGSSQLPYFFTCFLYFFQYQLLALGIYKFHNKLNFLSYAILFGIMFLSIILMFCIQMGMF